MKTKNKKKTPLQSIALRSLKTWIKDKNTYPPLYNGTKKAVTSPGQRAVKSHKSFFGFTATVPPDAVVKKAFNKIQQQSHFSHRHDAAVPIN